MSVKIKCESADFNLFNLFSICFNMIKIFRKPIVPTLLLLGVIVMIYVMSSSSDGETTPVNLVKNRANDFSITNQNIPQKEDSIGIKEEINDKEVVPDDKEISKEMDKAAETMSDMRLKTEPKVKANPKQEMEPDFDIQGSQDLNDYTDTPFMPKMANETLKAQLGNSAWRLFHTILARYPDQPSKQEQSTLNQYIQLFAQVYPCGDCARHFQQLLKKYPPQTKSRKTAALWGCHVHNKVNERLGKDEYDCTTILEDYDCGCGDDEQEQDSTLGGENIKHLNSIKVEENEDEQLGG